MQSYHSSAGKEEYFPYPVGWDKPFSALQRYETMEDLPNPPPPCGYKPCAHKKLKGDWLSEGRTLGACYAGNVGIAKQNVSNSTWISVVVPEVAQYVEDLRGGLDCELSHLDRWQMSSVWEKTKPHLEPDLDLLVFLAEIKEVPALVKNLTKKLAFLLEDVGTAAGKALKYVDGLKILSRHADVGKGGMLKIVMDEVTHAISNEWLEYNFALAPTVSELIGILSALFTWQKKVDDLKKGAGKKQRARYSFVVSDDVAPVHVVNSQCTYCEDAFAVTCRYASNRGKDALYSSDVPGRHILHLTPGGKETRVGLTVFYRYSLPAWVDEVSGKINALAGSLGINPGLGTIWELIPFSFVLDWILPIGEIFDRASFDAFPVKTEILDVCWTKRVKQSVLIEGQLSACPVGPAWKTLFQGELESFQRIVGTEPFTWIPAFRWPNWYQLSLGAALADLFRK